MDNQFNFFRMPTKFTGNLEELRNIIKNYKEIEISRESEFDEDGYVDDDNKPYYSLDVTYELHPLDIKLIQEKHFMQNGDIKSDNQIEFGRKSFELSDDSLFNAAEEKYFSENENPTDKILNETKNLDFDDDDLEFESDTGEISNDEDDDDEEDDNDEENDDDDTEDENEIEDETIDNENEEWEKFELCIPQDSRAKTDDPIERIKFMKYSLKKHEFYIVEIETKHEYQRYHDIGGLNYSFGEKLYADYEKHLKLKRIAEKEEEEREKAPEKEAEIAAEIAEREENLRNLPIALAKHLEYKLRPAPKPEPKSEPKPVEKSTASTEPKERQTTTNDNSTDKLQSGENKESGFFSFLKRKRSKDHYQKS